MGVQLLLYLHVCIKMYMYIVRKYVSLISCALQVCCGLLSSESSRRSRVTRDTRHEVVSCCLKMFCGHIADRLIVEV